jgi:hypothetical protein
MADTSADLRRRADMARFNREANDRAPTAWFAALPAKEQDALNLMLERNAKDLDRKARAAAKREARAIIEQAKRKA